MLSDWLWGKSTYKPNQRAIVCVLSLNSSISLYLRNLRHSEDPEVQWFSEEDTEKSLVYYHTLRVILPCHWRQKSSVKGGTPRNLHTCPTKYLISEFCPYMNWRIMGGAWIMEHIFLNWDNSVNTEKDTPPLLMILCIQNTGNIILVIQVEFLGIRKKERSVRWHISRDKKDRSTGWEIQG